MSTTVYFLRASTEGGNCYQWANSALLTMTDGGTGWYLTTRMLGTSRPSTTSTTSTFASTVAGPATVEMGKIDIVTYWNAVEWVSAPVDADVTISGSITFNLWGNESSMSANAAINCTIDKIAAATGTITQILATNRTTELATSSAVNAWSESPPSGVALNKGDRIRARVWIKDSTSTMGAGYQANFYYNSDTADVSGDSFLTFTETFGFQTTDPTTQTVYPTDTASDINPGSAVEKKLDFDRGSGATTSVTTLSASSFTPKQATNSAGGTAIEWYTPPLQSATLSGAVLVNVRCVESNTAANASPRVELAICDNDGTNPVVWGIGTRNVEISGTAETAYTFWVAGDDTSITSGKRVRVRLYWVSSSGAGMGAHNASLYYAGSAGATGDTYLTFPVTLASSGSTVSDSFDIDAILAKTQTPTGFGLDAIVLRNSGTKSIDLDAEIAAAAVTGDFDLDAIVLKTQTPTGFPASAVLLRGSGTLAFTIDAIIRKTIIGAINPATMTPTLVQSKPAAGTAPSLTATFDSATTAGNLLVMATGHRGDANLTWGVPSGWTDSGQGLSNLNGGWGRPFAMVYKIADGTETSVPSGWSYSGPVTMFIAEFSGVDISTKQSQKLTPGSNYNQIYCGGTMSVSVASLMVGMAIRDWVYSQIGPTSPTIEIENVNPGTGFEPETWGAYRVLSGSGSYTLQGYDESGYNPVWGGITLTFSAATETGFKVDALTTSAKLGSFAIDAIRLASMPGSFALDALVLRGITDDFTLDAWIAGTFPLDALLLATVTGDFDLDAEIRSQYSGSFIIGGVLLASSGTKAFVLDAVLASSFAFDFDLDAIVLAAGTGSFPLAAVVTGTVASDLDLDAILLRTQAWSFPADANLFGTVASDFDLDAEIRAAYFTFPVDALLCLVTEDSFALDAQIAVQIFFDDFERTVAQGLGGRWVWNEYDTWYGSLNNDFFGSTQAMASVDGVASFPADPNGENWESWAGYPLPLVGMAGFDFRAWDSTFSNNARFGLGLYHSSGIYVSRQSETGYALYQGSGPTYYSFTATRGAWYRVRGWWDGTTMKLKVWAVGSAEPDWQYSSAMIWDPVDTWNNQYPPLLDFYYTDENAPTEVDNVGVWTLSAPWRGFGGFQADAWKAGRILLASWIAGRILLDAWLKIPNTIQLDAVMLRAQRGLFELHAIVARNTIALDAIIGPGGQIRLAAVLAQARSGSFTTDAWLLDPATPWRSFELAAMLGYPTRTGFFWLGAEIVPVLTRVTGTISVLALCLAPASGSFILAAIIDSGYRTGSFRLDADLLGADEVRGTVVLDALVTRRARGEFSLHAEIARGWFPLSAWIAGRILVAAFVTKPVSSSFTVRAKIAGIFPLAAWITGTQSGTFPADAVVADANGAFPDHWGSTSLDALFVVTRDGPPFRLDAVVGDGGGDGFALDAQIRGAGSIPLEAFVQPYFRLDAYLLRNDFILWPEDGGPAEFSNGDLVPNWYKTARSYRIRVTVDGTDVTGDVIWSRTTFTQNAKTNPGTFEIALNGTTAFDGGEEVLVEIDDFRTFGGYVLSIERGYEFAASGPPLTILRGADFNVLFDKLIVYNRESADESSGRYIGWKAFAKDTLDTTIIAKVFGSYLDLPPGFDYTTHVETVGIAAPETPWAMPTAGSPLRQVMQSISQVTNAVWWIDPYMRLHYGSRSSITAPWPITDGLGGISSRALSIQTDMSMLVDDVILWGTLAYTTEGEIMAARRGPGGVWQRGEFRSDIHHQAYLNRRADSVIERYGDPIRRAKAVIFEPGYQAGQVVEVRSSEHGIDDTLVIRSMELRIAVAKEPVDGTWYGVPRFDLAIGLDPEEPWDIYDYLPFPRFDTDYQRMWNRHRDPTFDDLTTRDHATQPWETASVSYAWHTTHLLHNLGTDQSLTQTQGARLWSPTGTTYYRSAAGWVDEQEYPNGYTERPMDGYYYSPPSGYADGSAGFATDVFDGTARSDDNYQVTTIVPGWTKDYGYVVPWPGHEDHTGGEHVVLPSGDLERRSFYRWHRGAGTPSANRAEVVPKHIGSATIPTLVIQPASAFVRAETENPIGTVFYLLGVSLSRSEAAPQDGKEVIRQPVVPSLGTYDWNSVTLSNITLDPNAADIGFMVGSSGQVADGSLGDRVCPGDLPSDPWTPGWRWPNSPTPAANWLFCPFHIVYLTFDTERFGRLPVEEHVTLNNSPTLTVGYFGPAGWGSTSDGRFTWVGTGAAWDYTWNSYVQSGKGGVLSLTPMPDPSDIYDFDYQEATVFWDDTISTQRIWGKDWTFELTGYFEGSAPASADETNSYSPNLYVNLGGYRIYIYPGAGRIDPYNRSALDSPVDLWSPFTLRVYRSSSGFAVKIWQAGASESETWLDWWATTGGQTWMTPYIRLSHSYDATHFSPDPLGSPVAISFVCQNYAYDEGPNGLVFSGGLPTGVTSPFGDDTEGEAFGAVTQGWGCETVPVTGGYATTTGRPTRGTIEMYDANTGVMLERGVDWLDPVDTRSKVFPITTGATSVVVCYRNYVPEMGSAPSVPRITDASRRRHVPL